jgi:hypothetical protein
MKQFDNFKTSAQLLLIKKTIEAGYSIRMLIDAESIEYSGAKLIGTVKIKTGKMQGFCLNISKKESEV